MRGRITTIVIGLVFTLGQAMPVMAQGKKARSILETYAQSNELASSAGFICYDSRTTGGFHEVKELMDRGTADLRLGRYMSASIYLHDAAELVAGQAVTSNPCISMSEAIQTAGTLLAHSALALVSAGGMPLPSTLIDAQNAVNLLQTGASGEQASNNQALINQLKEAKLVK